MQRAAFLLLAAGSAHAIDNGYGMLPPMGWRSWNCYGGNVNQTLMEGVMDAVTVRKHLVAGKATSIADLGFVAIGLDDNWQACGTGLNGSFHDEQGRPLVNMKTFPDMKAMTMYGQNKGLRVGWYANNCICREQGFTDTDYVNAHMQQMAKAAADFGFDGIKLDGCGQFRNLTWWAQLLNETGRPMMIENCHWGGTVPGQTTGEGPCTGTTDISDCPYNFYRTSGDINPSWGSMFKNLQTTVKFLGDVPLSRPGAWAYPDMLEVGNMASHEEDRTHFSAWAITSSPLILGFDVTDDAKVTKVWDIISNQEVLAVSQTWAGHPGRLVKDISPWGSDVHTMQIWAKKLGENEQAVLVLSNSDSTAYSVEIALTDIGFGAADSVAVRDIYQQKDLDTVQGSFKTDSITTHDSRMYIFKKQ
eukprot:TRINITY_DN606_c0_g1_i1.p2 TRINITY_DN606_c0_g1~~TRINITY_DN606_c0_g1_i1.p2  ORF type:complete len:417 (+),score=173.06 TRINITY_DN606_c0_g1_i1:56-1306(+)